MEQPTLPGLPGPRGPRPAPRHRLGHVRVWDDPAVIAGARLNQSLTAEWRSAFARFLEQLPPERRAELRARVRGEMLGR